MGRWRVIPKTIVWLIEALWAVIIVALGYIVIMELPESFFEEDPIWALPMLALAGVLYLVVLTLVSFVLNFILYLLNFLTHFNDYDDLSEFGSRFLISILVSLWHAVKHPFNILKCLFVGDEDSYGYTSRKKAKRTRNAPSYNPPQPSGDGRKYNEGGFITSNRIADLLQTELRSRFDGHVVLATLVSGTVRISCEQGFLSDNITIHAYIQIHQDSYAYLNSLSSYDLEKFQRRILDVAQNYIEGLRRKYTNYDRAMNLEVKVNLS